MAYIAMVLRLVGRERGTASSSDEWLGPVDRLQDIKKFLVTLSSFAEMWKHFLDLLTSRHTPHLLPVFAHSFLCVHGAWKFCIKQ